MMKHTRKIYYLMALFFLFLFVACNSYENIRRDFEKTGYTYSTEADAYIANVLREFEEEDVFVRPHVFTKDLNAAIVLEFRSTQAIQERLDNSATLRGFLEDMKKTDIVRGNCLLVPIGINVEQMIQIFQGNYQNGK